MTFTVTYREKNGAKAEVEIEAASRAECFAHCKARGISPLGVKEGRAKRVGGEDGGRAGARPSRSSGGKPQSSILNLQSSIFLVAILAALAAIAWWWLGRDEAKPAEPKVAEKPRAAKPQPAPKPAPKPAVTNAAPAATNAAPAATNASAPATKASAAKKQETYFDERGIERYPGGMRVRRPAARTVKIEIDPKHRFKHTSEAQIAGLLEVKPGSLIVGDMKYSYRFVEDFKESLNEPIEILDTDSEYDKQLKRDVIESKKQLKAAMDRGEDIAQIMTDTRNELRRLGQYRENLMQELRKIRADDSYTDKDIEDFTTAANKMLEEKGCRPIKIPTLLIRYIREKQAQAQQNQQEEH